MLLLSARARSCAFSHLGSDMHLELFISIHSHSPKPNDISTLLENPSVHPHAYKKG